MLQLGMTATEILQAAVGSNEDPNSGGRQMPSHWSCRQAQRGLQVELHGHAVPAGRGRRRSGLVPRPRRGRAGPGDPSPHRTTSHVLITTGDGTTSEGEFWEALNTASNKQLPCIFLVEDNGYAISVPVEVQTAGGSISKAGGELPRPAPDHRASTAATSRQRYARCKRPSPTAAPAKAPRWCTPRWCAPTATPSATTSATTARRRAGRRGRARPHRPAARQLSTTATSRRGPRRPARPTSTPRSTPPPSAPSPRPRPSRPKCSTTSTARHRPHLGRPSTAKPMFEGSTGDKTMVDLLNACLRDEMARDPRIVIFGEDVADASREEVLDRVQGQGRRLQGHPRPADALRRRPRLQLAPRRGQHRRPRHRHGLPRAQARRRDPVPRLHLAGLPADPQRAGHDRAGASHGGWSARWSSACPSGGYLKGGAPYHSQSAETPVHPRPRPARGHARHRARRQRAAPHGHPLRRSGHLPRAQTPLPPDLQQGAYPGPDYMVPVRQGAPRARRRRPHRSSPTAPSCTAARRPVRIPQKPRTSPSICSTCGRSPLRLGGHRRVGQAHGQVPWWCTRKAAPGAMAPRSPPHRRGAVRVARRAGAPGGLPRHVRGLPSHPRRRRSCPRWPTCRRRSRRCCATR
jgi:2-oxoisovalerate dehydrogenase E1 component